MCGIHICLYKPTGLAGITHADRCRLLFIIQNSMHGHHKAILDGKKIRHKPLGQKTQGEVQ